MLKRSLLALLVVAAGSVQAAQASDSWTTTDAAAFDCFGKQHSSNRAARTRGAQTQTSATDFANTSDSKQSELLLGPLSPYQDHASLPAGGLYTTSDETA